MVQIPESVVRDAQAADSRLWPILLALARFESNYNPAAVGDNGCSLGYLQFNTCGGLGAGHGEQELLDGPSNMRLGGRTIRERLDHGGGLWEALQPWSTRAQAWEFLKQIEQEGVNGQAIPPIVPGTGTGGPPPQQEGSAFLVILPIALLILLTKRGS